jgi:ribonuclease T1
MQNFRRYLSILSVFFLLIYSLQVFAFDGGTSIAYADLPKEAQTTLDLIQRGGPFDYAKDGVVFGNYEGRLPRQKRGYYHEYTVKTPRARNRGARRIIAGADAQHSGEYYYTDDHYQTFRRILQ